MVKLSLTKTRPKTTHIGNLDSIVESGSLIQEFKPQVSSIEFMDTEIPYFYAFA